MPSSRPCLGEVQETVLTVREERHARRLTAYGTPDTRRTRRCHELNVATAGARAIPLKWRLTAGARPGRRPRRRDGATSPQAASSITPHPATARPTTTLKPAPSLTAHVGGRTLRSARSDARWRYR